MGLEYVGGHCCTLTVHPLYRVAYADCATEVSTACMLLTLKAALDIAP